ncbi:MAG: efflux RND transporter periplasmic adaptor subunit [Acidobacteriota bacterium]
MTSRSLRPRALLACAAGALLAGSLGLLVGCGDDTSSDERIVRPVRWVEVMSAGSDRERRLAGVAKAGVESALSFRIGGTVEELTVAVGDRVARTQRIARLDDTDQRLQLQESEASLAQAQAAARKADADYERVRGLYENQNAAKSDLDATRAQAESSSAQVEAARQRVARARRQLADTRLTAPLDGQIAAVRVEVNENVSPGQAVALLVSGSRPEVEVAVPEQLIARLRQGDAAEVAFDALPGTDFAAVVTEVGVARTGNSAAFPVTVRLEDDDAAIRSGMAATVTLHIGAADEAQGVDAPVTERIVVPPVAVGEDRAGRFVFALEIEAATGAAEETERFAVARRRAVEVGELAADGLEVLAGLDDGDLIATAGVRRLQDGQRVRLLDG